MPKEGKLHLTKTASPPAELPIYQRVDPREVSFFGRTNFEAALQEKKFIFGIKRVDRTRHIAVIGKGGTGKSQLLEMLARQDIAYGKGFCFFDPSGESITSLLDWIPESRLRDVVYINPLDRDFKLLFNPFAGVHPDLRYQVADGFTNVIQQQLGEHWTSELDHLTRMATLAILDYPRAALQGVFLLLTNERFRGDVIIHIKDPVIKRFWQEEFSSWDASRIMPLANKLTQFLTNPYIRNLFSERQNMIDMHDVLNGNKILLINLARGQMGEAGATFLAGVCMIKLHEAMVLRSASMDPFYIYIDEFEFLATSAFERFFLEARKHSIALALTHQYIDQLPSRTWAATVGTAGTLVVFRVGGEDSERLAKEMAPVFEARDLMSLGAREFYIKMSIDGETYDPFSAETLELRGSQAQSVREDIIRFVRRTYAVPKTQDDRADDRA